MPFIPNTPESLLGRSDSKNPETTCRGITSSGRPCRRPLASSPSSSLTTPPPARRTKPRTDDPSDPNLYCWQHREQASASARSSPGPRTSTTPILEARESLDTLVDRLGIIEASQQTPCRKPRRTDPKPSHNAPSAEKPPHDSRRKTQPKKLSFCFCFSIPIVEEERPARPRPRPLQANSTAATPPTIPTKPASSQHLSPSPSRPRPSIASSKHSSTQSHTSQTAQYLALVPASASPQTASALLAELAKPISNQDEPGYIYMFWLTPESQPITSVGASESLLAPPARPEARQRRPSDVLESFASKAGTRATGSKKTMLLKIGRASNVQRRLNEWSRQCGYNLSLIRYYPYISSSSYGVVPRKMPHSHKVERLIHLELAGAGLRISDRESCDACGRAHREWFEVDASREAVMMVDAAIKRWVTWDEGSQGG